MNNICDNFKDLIQITAKELEGNLQEIFKLLERVNNFGVYISITKKFKNEEIDDEFEKKYRRYYGMNNAGLTSEHFKTYFELLKSKTTDLEEIIDRLYQIKTFGGYNSIQLVFATKLIHTIDNNSPIIDNNISKILKLSNANGPIKKHEEVKTKFSCLFKEPKIRIMLEKARKEVKEKFGKDHELISDVKLLDSLLWALYSVIN
ncbi:MAG: hypothetical protein PHT40_04130 [Patescibacteria group bacterium]|nr:hypothetical protein [Patescibacteria group bacterium]